MLNYTSEAILLSIIALQAFTLYKIWCIRDVKEDIEQLKSAQSDQLKHYKDEIISGFNNLLLSQGNAQKNQLDSFALQLQNLTQVNESKLENIRKSVEDGLYKLQSENNDKLEKMRATVEEKLHETLEKRLSDSFQVVSERLEQVHKGLGEMQSLASGVGDLKKVLMNVKTRGTWGEVQLHALMDQVLSVQQYAENVIVNPNSNDRVEFAVKIPNKDDLNTHTWLPIDAKFPVEDYLRLIDAYEVSDLVQIEQVSKQLDASIKRCAKTISEKYICPPHTTDFAIMYLPTEGLYAEVLKKPGLIEALQRDYRIVITSPTTLLAIMNSLQMGFRTMAIEKRSGEVWRVLGTVKTEFIKFADVLNKTRIKLDQASKVIGDAETRTRVIQRHLKNVETSTLPINDNDDLLPLPEASEA
jgi:DNA recombination protein RmuC